MLLFLLFARLTQYCLQLKPGLAAVFLLTWVENPVVPIFIPFLITLIEADFKFNRDVSEEFFLIRFSAESEFSTQLFSTAEVLLFPESAMMKSACCRSWPWTLKCTMGVNS